MRRELTIPNCQLTIAHTRGRRPGGVKPWRKFEEPNTKSEGITKRDEPNPNPPPHSSFVIHHSELFSRCRNLPLLPAVIVLRPAAQTAGKVHLPNYQIPQSPNSPRVLA